MLVSIFNSLEKKALEYKKLKDIEKEAEARLEAAKAERKALENEIIETILLQGEVNPDKPGSGKLQAGRFNLSTWQVHKFQPGTGSTEYLKTHAPELLTPVQYAQLRVS